MARSWRVLRAGGILVAIAEPPDGQGGRHDVTGSATSWSNPMAASSASWRP